MGYKMLMTCGVTQNILLRLAVNWDTLYIMNRTCLYIYILLKYMCIYIYSLQVYTKTYYIYYIMYTNKLMATISIDILV